MKRCPQCRRDYYDETLNFCLDDGNVLLDGPASMDEPATAILSQMSGGTGGLAQPSAQLGEPTTAILHSVEAPKGEANSIAVLPFLNMSADEENEYFCDGLAEELLNALSKIDQLKVAARTSAFSFRGKNTNISEIGRVLGVKTVLEGSVRKSGDRLRITVQLINADDGYHLWSERYDREMKDIFAVQDEITLSVVDALKLKLLGSEKRAILKRHTDDPQAYQHYLRGRRFFFRRTPDGFMKAIEQFEKVIEIDPKCAVAYSGLGDSYVFLGFYEVVSPADADAKARPNILRAVELDPGLCETNTSVALLKSLYDRKYRDSLVDYQRAINIDPDYAFAHHLKAAIWIVLGEYEQAIAGIKRAIELDPFTPIFNAILAWWLYLARRNEDAIEQCNRTIEIAPNHFFAYWVLGLAFARANAYSDSIIALQTALSLNQFGQDIRADLGRVFGLMGEREEATSILNEFKVQAKQTYISPVNLAKIYSGLGEKEEAINQLTVATDTHAVKLPWFIVDPCLDDLRDDARFIKLLSRLDLPH